AGDLEFTVEQGAGPDLPTYAFATVVAPLDDLPDQEAALRSAMQALQLIFAPAGAPNPADAPPDADPSSQAPLDRRGFFRRLAGRR
ncbi:MAG: [NiFe]-hydrogenase assembly chaperone HybE, partial [Azonexus sp.]